MTLEELNALNKEDLQEVLWQCCGSTSWVSKMVAMAPFYSKKELLEEAENVWETCETEDWLEAFGHHPKIGNMEAMREKFNSTKEWASMEQSGVQAASEQVLQQLSLGNDQYEKKFGFIFIVCATGKSAEQMLELLQERLTHEKEQEIFIAMEEQSKITKIRLKKLLNT